MRKTVFFVCGYTYPTVKMSGHSGHLSPAGPASASRNVLPTRETDHAAVIGDAARSPSDAFRHSDVTETDIARQLILLSLALNTFASDWPQWRGPDRSGVNLEKGLANQWPEGGPKLLYKATGVGVGFSSVVIADGTLYTLGDLENACY